MYLLRSVLILSFAHNVITTDEDQRLLESDFSLDVIADFNTSKEYKPFNLKDFDALSRRFDDIWWYNNFAAKHYRGSESYDRSCYLVSMTYQMAYPEIRRYYEKRFLYVNNLEYEVGYLVHEIVWKYQMMVEIYQLVYKRYYMLQDKHMAPVSYLFYMYTNALEYSMAIIHLCNMLHELENKYKDLKKKSIFADYDEVSKPTRKRRRRNQTLDTGGKESYFQKKEEEQKKRQKERKKERKKFEKFGVFELTTPTRKRLKKGSWPLAYGWSIEDW